MAKARRKKKPEPICIIGPTDEQIASGVFRRATIAYRRVPMIDTLKDAGKLTDAEYSALAYYRDQAIQAEDDAARSSPLAAERIMGGGGRSGGSTTPVTLLSTPALLETARIERDLGSLLDIARAVAVDDMSLTQWCIAKHGGRERYDGKGKFIAMVPRCERNAMGIAHLELKHAARRIVR